MPGNKYKILIFMLLAILLLFPRSGMAKDYEISNYDFQIDVTEKGDYIITEEITYNFLEGSFSTAYREINNDRYRGLEFISLIGEERVITEREVKDTATGMKINWKYPSSSAQATFVLKYKAIGGLRATSDKNIMAMNVIEKNWNVPIKDIDVTIRFPDEINQREFTPINDVTVNNSRTVKFNKDELAPNSNYSIEVEFGKIMDVKGPQQKNYALYLLSGLILGLIIVIIEIINTYRNRPDPAPTNLKATDLGFISMANLYYATTNQNKKGISAAVFFLAQQRKIKLISKLNKKLFGQKDAEIKVDILSKDGLTELQEKLIGKLKEKDNLEKFMKDNKAASDIVGKAREQLLEKELLSKKGLNLRKKFVFLGILFIVLSIISMVIGFLSNIALIFGLTAFLMVYGIGSLIKTAFLNVLTPQGRALKDKIEELLDHKKDKFEKLLKEDKKRAVSMFFRELPYLVLHPKFNNHKLNKYKKEFKEVDDFKKPYWIEFDLSELDKTLDALEAVEVIDYVLMSTIMVAAYTSAGAAGAGAGGAGGGGAGGGGAA